MGMDNLAKALGFERENNWSQVLRYSDLAATKLKQLKDCPVEALSTAAKAIYARLQGSSSANVAAAEENLGMVYCNRAKRARAANDLARQLSNLELALPRFREAARIYRAINLTDMADNNERRVDDSVILRQMAIESAAAAAPGVDGLL